MDWQFEGSRIALAREANNLTQIELAKIIGATQQQLSMWESGEIKPGQDSLVKICNAMRTPPRFFFVQSGQNGNVE